MGKPNARERILEAAGKLFHKQGYSNVGINEIIRVAETAKASFYSHFASKEALCEAWLKEIHDRSEVTRQEILAENLPSWRKIHIYFDKLGIYLEESEFRGCPYTNTGAMVDTQSEGVLHQITRHKESLREFFRTIVEQEHGKSEAASDLGNQIFIIFSGASTEAQNLRDLWPVKSAQKAAVKLYKAFEV